ncbi:ABC transporter permease [Rhizobiaceae bacterium BDR2-2]|uniref:ABC transporter permease n=1 Tax=Ectorhizobium quercum TaxID=2965071 RepID=A0AAE3SVR8_9HYPH|nr:ABC transporter permease [Ectorhizobium quercum]MCX8998422.1 ABC transporter permease [Ectorhizobium quercum]
MATTTPPRSDTSRSPALPRSVVPFAAILVLMVLVALLAPLVAPADPNTQNLLARLKAPGFQNRGFTYYLGTDELGRDVLSRLIFGARISLLVAFASVLLSGIFGSILGMVAAFYRGWVETLIMRLVDIVLSVPAILLAIITVAILGPSLSNVVIVLALTRWPRYARVAYGQTLSVANMPYVRLSRFMGAGWLRLLGRHILPNIAGALVVVATLEFGLMVLFEAGLSFLGLGVQPPTASWGAMLSTGRNYVASAWWIATFPGVALFLLVLSINLIGDHVRDRLDPRGR